MGNDPIRIIVVDDSFFMRKLLRELLEAHRDFTVVAEAINGVEAVGLVAKHQPDVVTLDYNMPELNGAQTTKAILEQGGKTPGVLVISAYTEEGAEETFACLNAGAVDVVQKPSGELSLDIDTIAEEIVTKVHAAARAQHYVRISQKKKRQRTRSESPSAEHARAVLIGSSTGGPPVVEDIIDDLPSTFPVPLFVVQHMPAYFTTVFARRLNKKTSLKVKEAEHGETVTPGTVYIAPGDYHLRLMRSGKTVLVQLTKDEAVHGLRPSIDVTLTDFATVYGEGGIAIELTGMGEDGAEGAKKVKKSGGTIWAQSLDTATIDSMPASVINTGVVDAVLSPAAMIRRLQTLSKLV